MDLLLASTFMSGSASISWREQVRLARFVVVETGDDRLDLGPFLAQRTEAVHVARGVLARQQCVDSVIASPAGRACCASKVSSAWGSARRPTPARRRRRTIVPQLMLGWE